MPLVDPVCERAGHALVALFQSADNGTRSPRAAIAGAILPSAVLYWPFRPVNARVQIHAMRRPCVSDLSPAGRRPVSGLKGPDRDSPGQVCASKRSPGWTDASDPRSERVPPAAGSVPEPLVPARRRTSVRVAPRRSATGGLAWPERCLKDQRDLPAQTPLRPDKPGGGG
jgi:hypothetical protein